MGTDDADDFGERVFDRAVTVDELEGFTVDGTDTYFEPWATWGIDYSAYLQPEHFTGENSVFAHGQRTTILDGGGELFVGLRHFDLWKMWCGLGSFECSVLHLPNTQLTVESLCSACGDAAIAFDDEIDFGELMLEHPQQRGADAADVLTRDIQRTTGAVDETCAIGEVAIVGS